MLSWITCATPELDDPNIVRVVDPEGVDNEGVDEAVVGADESPKVKRPWGTWGELTASPNPSPRRGTNKVGVLGTMLSSPPSSYPCCG